MPLLLLSALLDGCAPAPPRMHRAEQPAASAAVSVLLILRDLPAAAWTLTVRHESGVEQQCRGSGAELTLSLPPGPCSLQLRCAGRTFARPLLVSAATPPVFWDLAGQDGEVSR